MTIINGFKTRFFQTILPIAITDYTNKPPKSRIFINGNVLSMDENNSIAQAIAIRRDTIEAVGSNEEIKRKITPETIITDLQGRTLIPGFIDAHSHFPGAGLSAIGVNLNSPPISHVTNINQAIEALKAKAKDVKKGKWLLGYGYDDTMIKDKRYLTCFDLDKVSKEHPIFVMHISGHLGMTNSFALKKAGIASNTPNPQGGVIRKDSDTKDPTGVLEEKAMEGIADMVMNFSLFDKLKLVKSSINIYAQAGITTAQNGLADEKAIKGLGLGNTLGLIPLRLMVWPDAELGERIINGKFNTKKYESKMFHVGAVKLISDGSIQGYTGYLSKPYHVPFYGDKSYRGYPIYKKEDLAALVLKFHKNGSQLAIHGNGDAAIDDILYAIEKAQKHYPRKDTRHIVIHAQMTRYDQLDKMKNLGVTPSFYTVHTYYWGDRHKNIFMGPERAARMSPTKTALGKGIRFTTHLDTPVVPMDPLLMVWSTVNRISSSGSIIGKNEQISPMQALRATTIDAAWQIFQEKNIGSLEKGKYADLVILSDSPLKNPEKIRDITVEETIVGGKTIYKQKL